MTWVVEAKLFGVFENFNHLFVLKLVNQCFIIAKQNLCNLTLVLLVWLKFSNGVAYHLLPFIGSDL